MQCNVFFVAVENISVSVVALSAFSKGKLLPSCLVSNQMKNGRSAKKSLRLSTTDANNETNAELAQMSRRRYAVRGHQWLQNQLDKEDF